MSFAETNLIAVVLAAIASYVFGAVWYMALANQWMAALGRPEAIEARGPNATPFIIAFVSQLLMAGVLAGLIARMGPVTVASAVTVAVLCWTGFVITTLATNHGFQGAKLSLTLIDGAHWLGVLLIQGAIIGAMGSGR